MTVLTRKCKLWACSPYVPLFPVERVSLGRDTADNLREDVEYEGNKSTPIKLPLTPPT